MGSQKRKGRKTKAPSRMPRETNLAEVVSTTNTRSIRKRPALDHPPSANTRSESKGPSSKTRSSKRQRFRRLPLSPLERLPNELLQTIYLESLEGNALQILSLPCASCRLESALAATHIYVEVFIHGFVSDSDGPAHDYENKPQERCAVQTRLLNLSWVNLNLIRTAHITFFTRKVQSKYRDFLLQDGQEVEEDKLKGIQWMVERSMDKCGKTSVDRFDIVRKKLSFEIEITSFPMEMWVIQTSQEVPTEDLTSKSYLGKFDLSHASVPSKLVCPPWTAEKCSLLEMLLSGGAKLAISDQEVAEETLVHAIRSGNFRAVTSLLSRLERPVRQQPRLPFSLQREEAEGTEENHECTMSCCKYLDRSAGLGVTRELLRIAVLEVGFNFKIVDALLHARCYSKLRRKDALWDNDLVNWTYNRSLKGDHRGYWLLCTLIDAHYERV